MNKNNKLFLSFKDVVILRKQHDAGVIIELFDMQDEWRNLWSENI